MHTTVITRIINAAAVFVQAPPTPAPGPGGISNPGGGAPMDFTGIKPGTGGLTKLDMWRTLASIVLYAGMGLTFLAFLAAIAVWAFGSRFLGQHAVTSAKQDILRAGAGAVLLTAAGGVFTWLTH
jgi:hypothetical protein